MNLRIKLLLVLSFALLSMVPTVFAAVPAPDLRYQRVFFVPECPICLEALTADDTVQTTCRHLFHRRCLDGALMRNNVCPSCRHDFAAPAVAHAEPAAPACCAAAARPLEHPPVVAPLAHPAAEHVAPLAARAECVRLPNIVIHRCEGMSLGSEVGFLAGIQSCAKFNVFIVKFDQEVDRNISDLFSIYMDGYQNGLKCVRINANGAAFRIITRKTAREMPQFLNELTQQFFRRETVTSGRLAHRFMIAIQQGNDILNQYFR